MACPSALRDRIDQSGGIIQCSSCAYDTLYEGSILHDHYDCFVFNCPLFRHEIKDHDLHLKQTLTPCNIINGAKVLYFLAPIANNNSNIDWKQFEYKFNLALTYYLSRVHVDMDL